jgi:internalin A
VNLKELTQLRELFLNQTQLTDSELASLKELTQLKALWLTDTKVTDTGVANLQKALPKSRIEH